MTESGLLLRRVIGAIQFFGFTLLGAMILFPKPFFGYGTHSELPEATITAIAVIVWILSLPLCSVLLFMDGRSRGVSFIGLVAYFVIVANELGDWMLISFHPLSLLAVIFAFILYVVPVSQALDVIIAGALFLYKRQVGESLPPEP
jgi:hypothetical protein